MSVEIRWPDEVAQFRHLQIAVGPEFLDVNHVPVKIGSIVHYTKDRSDADYITLWTPNRWGIVTALISTPSLDGTETDRSVRVTEPYVVRSRHDRYNRDEWFCDPSRLEVIQ